MRQSLSLHLAPLVLVAALATPGFAQAPAEAITLAPAGIEWAEIVPGASFGALYGDWSAEAHGKLARFDPGFVSPVHTHTHAYHGVVVSGTVSNPYPGEESPPEMGPGDYWFVPGGAAHVTSCLSAEPCLIYTHSDAAWDIEVVEGPQGQD